jgi:hypothetical protein
VSSYFKDRPCPQFLSGFKHAHPSHSLPMQLIRAKKVDLEQITEDDKIIAYVGSLDG